MLKVSQRGDVGFIILFFFHLQPTVLGGKSWSVKHRLARQNEGRRGCVCAGRMECAETRVSAAQIGNAGRRQHGHRFFPNTVVFGKICGLITHLHAIT